MFVCVCWRGEGMGRVRVACERRETNYIGSVSNSSVRCMRGDAETPS